jgi:hypothetical protein
MVVKPPINMDAEMPPMSTQGETKILIERLHRDGGKKMYLTFLLDYFWAQWCRTSL